MKNYYKLLILLFSIFSLDTYASHFTTGEIQTRHIGGNNYVITCRIVTDCAAIPAPTTAVINYSSSTGTSFNSTAYLHTMLDSIGVNNTCPTIMANTTCNGGSNPGYRVNVYKDTVSLAANGTWTLSWSSCCRYPSVNLGTTGTTSYIETKINSQAFPGNSSPMFPVPNFLVMSQNDTFQMDFSAIDFDGDSLVYSFVPCKTSATANATYTTGYSGTNPMNGLSINSSTGLLTKTTAAAAGAYFIAIQVDEYDPTSGLLKGSVHREMSVIVMASPGTSTIINNAPTANGLSNLTGATLNTPGGNTFATCGTAPVTLDVSFTGSTNVTLFSNIFMIVPGASFSVVEGTTSVMSINIPTANLMPGVYPFYVTAIEDTCIYSSLSYDSFYLVVNGSNYGPDLQICQGDSINLTPNISGQTASWTAISGPALNAVSSSSGYNISCTNCANPTVFPTATTTYEVTTTSGLCTSVDTITITVDTVLTINAISGTSLCVGDTIELEVGSGSGPFGWYLSSMTVPSGTGSTFSTNAISSISYVLKGDSMSACNATDTVDIIVNQNVSATGTTTICEGSSTQLNATGDSTLTWSPAASLSCSTCPNPIASPMVTTTYVVTSSAINNCVNSDTVIVTVDPNTTVSNDTTICEGDSVQLSVTGGTLYGWLPAIDLSCTTCPNPWASPTSSITYYVSSNGNPACNNVDTVNITVVHDRVVQGTVFQSSGSALPMTKVYLITYNPNDSTVTAIDSTTTDLYGAYSFTTTESTVYVKAAPDSATYPFEIPSYHISSELFITATAINANACDTITADITTIPGANSGTGFIAGNVYQGAGKKAGAGDPVNGLDLILVDQNNTPVAYWKTTQQGYLKFGSLPHGTYKVWVDRVGIDNSQAPEIVVNENSEAITYYFELNEKTLVRTSANSVEKLSAQSISLYPNPTQSVVRIQAQGEFTYEIISLSGQTIVNNAPGNSNTEIQVGHLPAGVYFVKVTVNDQTVVRRLIKE